MCVSLQWELKPATTMSFIAIHWYFLLTEEIIAKNKVIKNNFIILLRKVEKI